MIKRDIEEKLNKLLFSHELHKNVILVEGARQVGKTTLIQTILKSKSSSYLELNLEKQPAVRSRIDACRNFKEFEQYLNDDFGFRQKEGRILFIDEAQESEKLGSFVRSFKEDWESTATIITGSALVRLFREEGRYPIGRVVKFHLQPFSFIEFLRALGKDSLVDFILNYSWGENVASNRHEILLSLLNQYIAVGGLPEVVLLYAKCLENNSRDWYSLRENLILSYRDDFIRYFGIEKANLYERAMDVVAANVGSPSKDSQLAKPGTAGYKMAPDIYSRLESWRMIHKVPQKGSLPEKTQFAPKRYLFDMGVLDYFRFRAIPNININFSHSSEVKIPLGGVLENFLLLQTLNDSPAVSGFRKKQGGSEVDFIFDFAGEKIPVECKSASKNKLTHIRGLIEYKKTYQTEYAVLFNLATPLKMAARDAEIEVRSLPLYLAGALGHLVSMVKD